MICKPPPATAARQFPHLCSFANCPQALGRIPGVSQVSIVAPATFARSRNDISSMARTFAEMLERGEMARPGSIYQVKEGRLPADPVDHVRLKIDVGIVVEKHVAAFDLIQLHCTVQQGRAVSRCCRRASLQIGDRPAIGPLPPARPAFRHHLDGLPGSAGVTSRGRCAPRASSISMPRCFFSFWPRA